MPSAGIPESFKVLVKEIRSLALDIEPISYQKRAERTAPEGGAETESAVDVFANMAAVDDLVDELAREKDNAEEVLVGDATSDKE